MDNYLINKCAGCGEHFKSGDRILYARFGEVTDVKDGGYWTDSCRVKLQPHIKPSGIFHIRCMDYLS